MCVEREGGRKRGEAGAHQGSRMRVLIKKTQIAAQQMIFSRHKTVVGGDKDAWDICEPWCGTYLANASAGGKAQVVIISIAAPQREDVNVWETHQFLVPSLLLMWFWRFVFRSISVTCSLESETSAQKYMSKCLSRPTHLLIYCSWQIYCTAGVLHTFYGARVSLHFCSRLM